MIAAVRISNVLVTISERDEQDNKARMAALARISKGVKPSL
jgi:hypothetical protein